MNKLKDKKIIEFIGVYIFFAPILHCLSLLQISKEIPVAINLGFSFALINFLYISMLVNNNNLWKIDWLEVIIIIFVANSIIISILKLEINQTLIMRLVGVTTCLSMYAYGRRLDSQGRGYAEKLANYSIMGVIFSIIIIYAAHFKGMPVYFGLGTDYMLLGLCYYAFYKDKLKIILLMMILFLMGGKRGELIVAGGFFLIYLLKGGKITAILGLIMAISLLSIANIENIESLQLLFQKFDFNYAEMDFDTLNALTSYRLDEVVVVWGLINENIYSLLFGGGLGARYELYGDMVSTVHFSPLGIAWIYGLGFSLYLYILLPIYVIWKVNFARDREASFWLMVFLSQIFVSLSVFSILLNPIQWFALGRIMYIASRDKLKIIF